MPDDVRPLDAERVENAGHVPNDGGQPIIRDGRRLAAASTAAQVGDDHAEAALDERGDLVAPQIARVRKAVQQDDRFAGALVPDMELEPVGLDQLASHPRIIADGTGEFRHV